MFEFMRRKKEVTAPNKEPRTEGDGEKNKSKSLLRRSSLVPTSKGEGSSTKRARYFSAPNPRKDDISDHLTDRPSYPRARSSSCSAISSLDMRNPFQQYSGDSAMTASQIALTESMSCLEPGENMRYVVSHAPLLVNLQAERAEVLFSDEAGELQSRSSLRLNPFADETYPMSSLEGDPDHGPMPDHERLAEVDPARDTSRKASPASLRRPMDYLQVKIPAGIMSPPLAEPHRTVWARI